VCCTVDNASFSGISEAIRSGLVISKAPPCFRWRGDKFEVDKIRVCLLVAAYSSQPLIQGAEFE
jgi:hypothetical protein